MPVPSPTPHTPFWMREQVFKKAGRLLTHERKHTGERPFSCTECTKSFRDSAALEGHIARQHRTQPYHCTTCSKGFSSQRQLKIHARVHSGEKPFNCAVCHRKFSQEGTVCAPFSAALPSASSRYPHTWGEGGGNSASAPVSDGYIYLHS